MTRPRINWRAGADGTAHAHRAGHPRTLCGQLVLPERSAWPGERKCLACRAVLEPVPEGEARLLWGNR